MAESEPLQRRRVIFSGHVQGVGFRYNTQRAAQGTSVDGFVRNLPDGTVELVAEGTATKIDQFVANIRERMGDYIASFTDEALAANGEFSGFRIR